MMGTMLQTLSSSSSSVLFRCCLFMVCIGSAAAAAASDQFLHQHHPEASTMHNNINHGRVLMDWLKTTEGGFFHPKLEIRKQQKEDFSPFYGMYATDAIGADEVLLRIPRQFLLTPATGYAVGDRVIRESDDDDGESWVATIHKIELEDSADRRWYSYQLVYDDGDWEDDVPEDKFYPVSYQCKTVQRLVKEMKLRNESEFAPYVNYLNSQPTGQLPSKWSRAGQDLLLKILGSSLVSLSHNENDKNPQGVLPPVDPLNKVNDYHEACNNFDPFFEDAYLLLEQRGWDEIMIPVFDMMSHGNGRWLNTRIVGSVHDYNEKETAEESQVAPPVTVLASRGIAAGEEIITTYNRCEDCQNRYLWYGTPELLRDYGFVETYPQRWVFWNETEEEATIFDIDQAYSDSDGEDGDLKLTWVEGYKLASMNVPFFAGQLRRLQDLGRTLFATTRDPDIPEHEWRTLSEFREAYVTAIRMALVGVAVGHGDDGGGSTNDNDDQSCAEAGS